MTGLWAIIPVKPLDLGKSRLAYVLSNEQRQRLNEHLLRLTLQEVVDVPQVDTVVTISRDKQVLDWAMTYGVNGMSETGECGLNAALDQATRAAIDGGASGVLIVPADLPKLRKGDLENLIMSSRGTMEMTIVPDRREEGTNTMLLFPPGMVEYCYGNNSFELHKEQARKKGLRLVVHRNPFLEFDIDLPEDLDLFLKEHGQKILFKDEEE